MPVGWGPGHLGGSSVSTILRCKGETGSCAEQALAKEGCTSVQEVMDGLAPASSTVASIRGATGNACTMTLAARWGTLSGFLSKAMRSALVGSCTARGAQLCLR